MIALKGLLGAGGTSDWWDVSSATPLAAWQAKGAASSAAAKLDLTGNEYNLAGADPVWSSADGFTDYVSFDSLGIMAPLTASFVWAGELNFATSGAYQALYNVSTDYNGIFLRASSSNVLAGQYAGTAQIATGTVSLAYGVSVLTKDSSSSYQELFYDATSIGERAAVGDPSDRDVIVYTGVKFWAAAIYSGVLSSADITAITNALNNL